MVCKLSFDELPEFGQKQRPDYILLLDDGEVIIVEETGRPEFRDVERVRTAAVMLKKGHFRLPYDTTPSAITGVVHYRHRDTTFSKYLSNLQKKLWDKHRIHLLGVSCQRELMERLRITFKGS